MMLSVETGISLAGFFGELSLELLLKAATPNAAAPSEPNNTPLFIPAINEVSSSISDTSVVKEASEAICEAIAVSELP